MEADASQVTVKGAAPDCGVTVIAATGAWGGAGGDIVNVRLPGPAPAPLVAVNVSVNVPADVGTPEMSPVVGLIDSQLGRPPAL